MSAILITLSSILCSSRQTRPEPLLRLRRGRSRSSRRRGLRRQPALLPRPALSPASAADQQLPPRRPERSQRQQRRGRRRRRRRQPAQRLRAGLPGPLRHARHPRAAQDPHGPALQRPQGGGGRPDPQGLRLDYRGLPARIHPQGE